MRQTRRLDHAVLAVDSLARAREVLEGLGLTVAPEADHPFGTRNACVFFADGTFLEPLAIGHRETCEAVARDGQPFVVRDQAHRFRVGCPSFSGVAFASRDADGDAQEWREAGFGTGEAMSFGRRFIAPDGAEAELGFRLGFARDLRAPDVAFFACQTTHTFKPDRSRLTAHANGATGIARIVMGEPNPSDFQYYLQCLTGDRESEAGSFGMTLDMGPANRLEVATREALAIRYGVERGPERGLSFHGVVLTVPDLGAVRSRAPSAPEFQGRIVAPLADNTFIAFEETQP